MKTFSFKVKNILESQLATPRNCVINFPANKQAEGWNYYLT